MEDPKTTLRRARNIQLRIDRREAELKRLREMEVYLSATDYSAVVVKHSTGRGSVEQLATGSKLAELEERIEQDVKDLAEAKLDAIALISMLDDTRCTEILWEYYIHAAGTWDDVARAVGYDPRHVRRLHGRALQQLRMSLNVREDL